IAVLLDVHSFPTRRSFYLLYSCLNWQFAHAYVFRFLPNAPPTNPTGPNKIAPAAAFPPLKPFLSSPTNFQPFSSLHIGHFFGAFFMLFLSFWCSSVAFKQRLLFFDWFFLWLIVLDHLIECFHYVLIIRFIDVRYFVSVTCKFSNSPSA